MCLNRGGFIQEILRNQYLLFYSLKFMNLVDSYVVEVLSEPYFNYMWCVDVMANCYGHVSKTTIHFTTLEAAKQVTKGYKYLS